VEKTWKVVLRTMQWNEYGSCGMYNMSISRCLCLSEGCMYLCWLRLFNCIVAYPLIPRQLWRCNNGGKYFVVSVVIGEVNARKWIASCRSSLYLHAVV